MPPLISTFNVLTKNTQGPLLFYLPRILKFMYYIVIITAFCSNMMVVAHTTALSVLGAGLALRGPDGSMVTATDGLYEERKNVFLIFGMGLACTVGSVVICAWLFLQPEAALVCMCISGYTCYSIYKSYRRVLHKFEYDESETVDFNDIFEGPAAIRGVPSALRKAVVKRGWRNETKVEDDDDSPYSEEEAMIKNGRNGLAKKRVKGGTHINVV